MMALFAWLVLAVALDIPAPAGRLVDGGGHRLHMLPDIVAQAIRDLISQLRQR